MTRGLPTTKAATRVTMTHDEVRDTEAIAGIYRWVLRDLPRTRYTDPALHTVHEVAARALNPPTSHVEVVT